MNSRRLIVAPEDRTADRSTLRACSGRGPMSALGQADIRAAKGRVCFTLESGHVRCSSSCLLWANSGHLPVRVCRLLRPKPALGQGRSPGPALEARHFKTEHTMRRDQVHYLDSTVIPSVILTSSARDFTPIFWWTRARCTLMVFSPTPSFSAMVLLCSPATIKAKTSFSLSVSFAIF